MDFRRHPVGTGPFQLTAWAEGQTLILRKNDHYWERDLRGERLPYLPGLRVSFYDSKATEFLLFRQGQLDFINDLDASFKDEVLLKSGALKSIWQNKIVLQTHPYLNTEYLGIQMDSTQFSSADPLRLRQVRQAINCGFDRRKMILYLRNSLSTPAESGFVPEGCLPLILQKFGDIDTIRNERCSCWRMLVFRGTRTKSDPVADHSDLCGDGQFHCPSVG